MFTGIVTAIGSIAAIDDRGRDRRLGVTAAALPLTELAVGESIAVNGVCLTATAIHDRGFDADVSAETLSVTTLGRLQRGSRVNLEPALALGQRLGGHIVSGHVDGIARVVAREDDGRAVRFRFELPAALARYVAKKGSVCIDGVSLTVNEVSDRSLDVAIIPHTLSETIIGDYAVGTSVNIEVDQMARYLERLIRLGDDNGITKDFLKAHGYG